MTLYNVYTDARRTDETFVMTAPLTTLRVVFGFAPSAVERIERHEESHYHFNNRPSILGAAVPSIWVVRA